MSYIHIVESDDVIPFHPIDPVSKAVSETTFLLRVLEDKKKAEFVRKRTQRTADRQGPRDDTDWNAYVADCLKLGIVGWEGLKQFGTGAPIPYSEEMKAAIVSKLPESVKTDIMRVIAGREVDAEAAAEASAKNS